MTLTEWMGIASTIGLAVFALMKFRQAQKVDAAAVRAGLLSNHREGTGQMIGGYSGLVDQLQEQIIRCEARLDASNADRDALRLENARLRRKLGNGNDTPNPPNR